MVKIRYAEIEDAKDIAALFNRDPNFKDPFFSRPEQIAHRLANFDVARLVAVDATGRIIGFAAAQTFSGVSEEQAKAKVAEVKKVNVHPDFRGRGIASGLYDARLTAIIRGRI